MLERETLELSWTGLEHFFKIIIIIIIYYLLFLSGILVLADHSATREGSDSSRGAYRYSRLRGGGGRGREEVKNEW